MSRWSRYDSDDERLPDGMTRIGYDADEQVYTFKDSDGSIWESAPGCEYGQLTRVGQAPAPIDDDDDTHPFLVSEPYQKPSWRAELMPLLNFGMLIGLSLIGLFWYLHVAGQPSHDDTVPKLSCSGSNKPYAIQKGDTCWDLAEDRGITVDELVETNPEVDCDKLLRGSEICLPQLTTPIRRMG